MQRFSFIQWRALLLALFLVATLGVAAHVVAQSTAGTGSIQGIVTDQTGAVLAGANITISNKATGYVTQRSSSPAGVYSSGPLQPAHYTVRFEAKGFKTTELGVTAWVAVVSTGNVQMQVGQESEVVHQGPQVTVNMEQAVVQGVLDADRIYENPVGGRNYLDLAQLEPGVQVQDGGTVDAAKNGFSSISFLGRYGRAGRYEVDGVDITDESVGATTQNIPASAIQEFNLSQSTLDLSTELTSTGSVNIATRSGSNDLHGEGFGVFRGNEIAANLPG